MSAYRNLLNLFNARLSQKIVFWVFLNIITIELIILFPSVRNREQYLLTDLEHFSDTTVELIQQNLSSLRSQQHKQNYLELSSKVLGGRIYGSMGNEIYAFGQPPELSWTQINRESLNRLRSDNGLYYDVAYFLEQSDQQYVLVIRHDSSSINGEIQAYVWRIAGLVAIISIFVTIGTMLALGPLVISPILQLRQDLIRAGKVIRRTQANTGDRDSGEWAFPSMKNKRNDELGEAIIAFGEMYRQLVEEIGDRTEAESALQALNRDLELRVEERTAQLNAEVQKSEQALADLQQAQMQLVHAGKMSSLGRIIAGIAHEVNNPISFIYGNLNPAKIYIQDLLDIINIYQDYYPEIPRGIKEKMEAVDFSFVVEDLPELLNSMQSGADRIRQLILSLRNFARLDETEFKKIDIHEGIESSLIILEHRLKQTPNNQAIQIVKNYGNLPAIDCYAGQMNQVFINILENAIDAIEERSDRIVSESRESSESYIPTLQITTKMSAENSVVIQIIDNGIGMTEEASVHALDPFFTTKKVGDGTGLGLSIAYEIVVKKHGGKLECHSSLEQGTELEIRLPLAN